MSGLHVQSSALFNKYMYLQFCQFLYGPWMWIWHDPCHLTMKTEDLKEKGVFFVIGLSEPPINIDDSNLK